VLTFFGEEGVKYPAIVGKIDPIVQARLEKKHKKELADLVVNFHLAKEKRRLAMVADDREFLMKRQQEWDEEEKRLESEFTKLKEVSGISWVGVVPCLLWVQVCAYKITHTTTPTTKNNRRRGSVSSRTAKDLATRTGTSWTRMELRCRITWKITGKRPWVPHLSSCLLWSRRRMRRISKINLTRQLKRRRPSSPRSTTGDIRR
jgi:hypothetical protein